MYSRFRKISLLMAYAVATIPLWYYVTDDRIILLMTVVVGFAYLNVVLSSVDAAQGILSSEKAKTPMPRWLPDKPKFQKWWAIMHHTMRWHVLLIPAKMGLSLGFVQWLHLGTYQATISILRPYYYFSYGHEAIYPQWETALLGLFILIVFSFLENVLIAALTILTTSLSRVVTLRLLIAFSVVGVMSQYQVSLPHVHYLPYTSCHYLDSINCGTWNPSRNARRIGETIEIGVFSLDDTGVLVAANAMRPPVFGYRCCQEDGSWYVENRPFVARQLVAALLGVLVYIVTIFTVLGFVRDNVDCQ